MENGSVRAWIIGFLIVLLFVFVGELAITVDQYVYSRLGIDLDSILLCLWLLPFIAAFVAVYFGEKYRVLAGLSYILILPILAVTAHAINGQVGTPIDFAGIRGSWVLFQIYFFLGGISIVLGVAAGFVMPKRRRTENSSVS